ncbi:MAG TPA: ATP-binding cassette domain-containing protein [Candidatus Onthoplasma faecigallinarum]|nr:ATP-binding cassette domain-containing protein [Candidatus Onthoplasma faecigallinarum]
MLEISKICKDYVLKDQTVSALKDIDICFRRSEFVSILGPSGCGKTTLLNIIGGLDRYTSGDLIIDGVSTKEYKDKDWDNYRNHKVGFVFQNYNLIPHQTVLENVEIALTLSGIKKDERKRRAIEVLEKVGLKDKLKSKPNQLSGGQMQRVAIARALVNDPEIILADEPTGALDSKTSVQIMEILKEISKDKLVVMVTHNPDLAEEYSTRIIRLLDGELKQDTNPYTHEESIKEIESHKAELEKDAANNDEMSFKKTEKKKSMSFFTALALSFKNMLTKKGRTIMVSFAGSIGIIGIALILAVSAGMTGYIENMQSDSLSSYPVSVSCVAIDYQSAMDNITGGNSTVTTDDDGLTVYNPQDVLIRMGRYNYMSADFVNYIKDYYSNNDKMNMINDYNISYATTMRILTQNSLGAYVAINSSVMTSAISGVTSSTFFEGLNNQNYLLSLYDVVGGENAHYPTNRNEVALVLNGDSVSTTLLDSLGIEYSIGEDGNYTNLQYEDIIGKTYKLLLNDAYYNAETEQANANFDLLNSTDTAGSFYQQYSQQDLENLYNDENTIELTITCVLQLKDDAAGSIFSDGIMYTQDLVEFYRNDCKSSNVVQTLKTKYLDGEGNLINGDESFVNRYTVRISELQQYLNMDNGMFSYNTPNEMKVALNSYFQINLTDEELIDLYLQVYGASDVPTGIYFYASNFDSKDDIIAMIDSWNAREGVYTITYTDSSELLTNILGNLVNIISYVLIAFAAISLVVSSIMIAIITYTSVIERTKEIGVLRSIGASKRDVSRVFNAETTIIGLAAGLIGVIVAGLLTIPIGLILESLTGIGGLAVLEPLSALILVVISVVLTFVAGLVPAHIASKKDPVLALRSE